MDLKIKNIHKTYAGTDKAALHGVTLTIVPQEFVAIVGPSGCGKSTLLKIIAGLDTADAGSIEAPTPLSMDFQSAALLPWLTVEENVAFGLEALKKPHSIILAEVKKYLKMVGLDSFALKYPRELSGGQRQRAGLARALAVEPKVLLLDEPFSALDPKTTHDLHEDLLKIWKQTNVTIVMISHLIEEAVSLADRVILMKDGKIEDTFSVSFSYPRRENGVAFHEEVQKIRAKFFA